MSQPGKPIMSEPEVVEQSRLYVRDPSWQVAQKQGSERVYCHAMSPGETHYHRLTDGEIHLRRGDERLCLPCAGRFGLLRTEARSLGTSILAPDVAAGDASGYEIDSPSS